MSISQYWVGQIPALPLVIDVQDSKGNAINLLNYTTFTVNLLGSDNEEVDLDGSTLETAGADSGRFVFRWPTGRSVFENSGDYLLQLEMDGDGVKDFTTVHDIKVHKFGGVK